jgi:hypothetical protein
MASYALGEWIALLKLTKITFCQYTFGDPYCSNCSTAGKPGKMAFRRNYSRWLGMSILENLGVKG